MKGFLEGRLPCTPARWSILRPVVTEIGKLRFLMVSATEGPSFEVTILRKDPKMSSIYTPQWPNIHPPTAQCHRTYLHNRRSSAPDVRRGRPFLAGGRIGEACEEAAAWEAWKALYVRCIQRMFHSGFSVRISTLVKERLRNSKNSATSRWVNRVFPFIVNIHCDG